MKANLKPLKSFDRKKLQMCYLIQLYVYYLVDWAHVQG